MKIRAKIIFFTILIIFLKPALGQDKEILSLSLEESIARALKNNLYIAAEAFGPEIAESLSARAKEIFLPRVDLNFGSQHQENPPYWWIQGEADVVDKYTDYGVSFGQLIPTGGNFSLVLTNYKTDTTQAFQLLNPRYGSTLRLDFRQPLLKNFGLRVTKREILASENNLQIAQTQLRGVLIETAYRVEEAYWNLVFSIENYRVKQQSLDLARDLLAKNKKEVEFGQLAPIEILNAEAVVAEREADILQAEAFIQRSEEVLKSIINIASEGDVRYRRVVPVDKPDFIEKEISLEVNLGEALSNRPDLQVAKTEIEKKELGLSVARNQMLPSLDLQISYWSPGISGDRLIYEGDDPFYGAVVGKEKGSAGDSLRDAFKLLYNNWSVGLTLSLPLSTITSRADLARATIEKEQAKARIKDLEQKAILEVSEAVRAVETNARRVRAYRVARELAQKRLEAEEKKLSVGLSTNYFVLEFQEELANARSQELKALIDYRLSLAYLEKAVGKSPESRIF